MDDEDPEEIVAEFYPEQMAAAVSKGEALNVTTTAGETQGQVEAGQQGPAEGEEGPPAETQTSPGGELTGGGSRQDAGHQRRSRRNKFSVDPELFNGKTEIATCGVTPALLLELGEAAKDPSRRTRIKDYMAEIGYDELSFLREDEAQALLQGIHADQVEDLSPSETKGSEAIGEPTNQQEDPAASDDKVQCPYDGEFRSKPAYCLSGQCTIRKRDGFCPMVEDPPASVGLGI